MSSSLPAMHPPSAPYPQPAPELPPGMHLPVALGIALCFEAGLIAAILGMHGTPSTHPAPPPQKIVRLVTIADVPGTPEATPEHSKPAQRPRPAPPRQEPSKPRPPARPAAAPSEAPAAPSTAPVADAKPSEAPASVQPARPPQHEVSADTRGGVRRGLVPLVRVEPDYPPRALANNIEGVIVVHATISADGSVTAVNVVSAQPAKIFDQEAVRAVMRWKFSPNDGGMVGEIQLRFSLSN